MISRTRYWAAAVTAGTLMFAAAAAAQQGTPNALQGFAVNRDQPLRIEAQTLEVRDKSKIAQFLGNVRLTQGEMTMTCKTLDVYYEDQAGKSQQASSQAAAPGSGLPGQGGSQQIRKVEAHGGVKVTQKDQTATGERAVMDVRTNQITLSGNVIVTQGKNIIRGDRLMVDLASGVSRVESRKGGPVDVLIDTSTAQGLQGSKGGTEAAKEQPKRGAAPGAPMRVNSPLKPARPSAG
jgi:lipopolysaccharide export system protein LptA